jgi:hypothetical protein
MLARALSSEYVRGVTDRKGSIMTLQSWPQRAWCALGSALAGAVVLALVGAVLTAVAITTRLVLGLGVT